MQRQAEGVRRKVLIVDDEPEIVRAVKLRLGIAGYDVVIAMDGASAVREAISEQPDVILLDIGLPGGNGHIVADMLGSDATTADIPILFFSARTDTEDVHRARASGAVGFISKPYDPEELLRRVASAMKSNCVAL